MVLSAALHVIDRNETIDMTPWLNEAPTREVEGRSASPPPDPAEFREVVMPRVRRAQRLFSASYEASLCTSTFYENKPCGMKCSTLTINSDRN